MELLHQLETVRNKLPTVDRAMIQYGAEQGVPNVLSCRSDAAGVDGLLSACPQVRRTVGSRPPATSLTGTRMLGEPLPPLRHHLAAAQRAGLVTPEQVSLIDTTLGKVKHYNPDAVKAGEIFLVEHAGQARLPGPRPGRRQAGRGDRPRRHPARPMRPSTGSAGSSTSKQRRDGSWAGDFRLTPEVGQKLAALLGPLMKPQDTTIDPDRRGQSGRRVRTEAGRAG